MSKFHFFTVPLGLYFFNRAAPSNVAKDDKEIINKVKLRPNIAVGITAKYHSQQQASSITNPHLVLIECMHCWVIWVT